MNYYRRFPGDYLRDTMGLNLLQHGAYTLLLDHLYATETRIQTEAEALAVCRANTQEEKWAVSVVLEKFFKKTVTGFTNKRFEKEAKTRKDWCKWQKNHRDKTPDKALTVRTMSSRSPLPLPSPKKEEETSNTFHPPTQAEVCAFMQSRKVPDAERQAELFLAHHENRKWRLSGGRGPVMVSWRKAVVTWQASIPKFSGGNHGTRQSTTQGASRAEQRITEAQRQNERVLGRTSGLVGSLRSDLPGRPDGGTPCFLPGNSEAIVIETGSAARSSTGGSAAITRIPAKAGASVRNSGDDPVEASREPAKVS